MRLGDFKGVFKTQKVKFISAKNVSKDFYEIRLEKPKDLRWVPGEHGIFSIPNKKINGKKWRAFSIASTQKEDVILLGTRTGETPSSFKQTLISLKEGDEVKLRGPFGWFKLRDNNSPLIFIAMGVGITPVRALLTQLKHAHHRTLHLVYSSKEYFLFKDEIQEIIDHNEHYSVHYVESKENTIQMVKNASSKFGNDALYYISGSTDAIKNVKIALGENGIKNSRMINDPFLGY